MGHLCLCKLAGLAHRVIFQEYLTLGQVMGRTDVVFAWIEFGMVSHVGCPEFTKLCVFRAILDDDRTAELKVWKMGTANVPGILVILYLSGQGIADGTDVYGLPFH